MSSFQAVYLTQSDAIRAQASNWDDLWSRSNSTDPTLRAEPFSQMLESFHSDARCVTTVVVDSQGKWLALLPLVMKSAFGRMVTGRLYHRPLYMDGILMDPNANRADVIQCLFGAITQLRLSRIWLENVPLSVEPWREWIIQAEKLGIAFSVTPDVVAGQVAIQGTWSDYLGRMPQRRRADLRRTLRRAAEQHVIRFELIQSFSPESVETAVREGFAVEDASWKGSNGSSVIKRGWLPFFIGQAKLLAASGQLCLAFLWAGSTPIAFGYMPYARKHLSLVKYGYSLEFRRLGPGQLLIHHILQHMFSNTNDFAGLLFPGTVTWALGDWVTSTEQYGQIAMGNDTIGRAAIWLHEKVLPKWKKIRSATFRARQENQNLD